MQEHLRAGDAARDARNWAAAEAAYRAYLDGAREDAGIWVQYGHALKEQGHLDRAEAAYRRSLDLRPEEADTYLQLGHVLKLRGRPEEARQAYATSLRLSWTVAAQEEVDSLGGEAAQDGPAPAGEMAPVQEAILVEVDSLLGYLRHHTTLSGIQRVQVNLFEYLVSGARAGQLGRIEFVRYDEGQGAFRRLALEAVEALVTHCTGDRIDRGHLDPLLHEAEHRTFPVRFEAGQCFLVTGAFWDYRSVERYLRVKAAGVPIGVFLYDLIPVTHPEFCDTWLVSDFSLTLAEGFLLFDFALTSSEYSAKEIRRYVSRNGLRPLPVEVVRLAHVVKDSAGRGGDEWTDALQPVRGRPYVLAVGTIEARKNHAYLVACWKLLLQEGVEPPDLVFVGRQGMRTRDFVEQLRATDHLDGRIHVLHGLSDGELETLYRHALFTTVPSFVEGWGQVPGESLAHGVPCIASNAASLPEVGGDLVDYVDPYNARDGVAAYRRMILDKPYRERRREAIRAGFRPRTWRDFGGDLLRAVAEQCGRLPARPTGAASGAPAPLLEPGRVLRVGDLHMDRPVPQSYPSHPLRLVLAEGCYAPDTWGAWLRDREALLRFATPCEPGTEIVLYLQFFGASGMDGVTLTVRCSGADAPVGDASRRSRDISVPALPTSVTTPVRSDERFSRRLLARVGEGGVVEARLGVRGDIPTISETSDTRLSVGIVAVAYAPRADAATRADLADAFAALPAG